MPRRGRWSEVVAGLALAVVGSACGQSRSVGSPPAGAQAEGAVTITGASVSATNQIVVSYTVAEGGQPASAAVATSLVPSFTLAGLSTDPVSGVPAWQSFVLTGGALPSLPIDGPGTPGANVLTNTRQPGAETAGAVKDLGGGKFTYTFLATVPPTVPVGETLRVGVWLDGAVGTAQTSSTLDFTRDGSPVQQRQLVLDANCDRCHGLLQGHDGARTGVALCLTCHTYQNADPSTVDPAAMGGATPATNPNPLDLGRLVHRIHRGRELPTLYVAPPTVPGATRANLSLPFNAQRNVPLPGQKFSIVGPDGAEHVFGQSLQRIDHDLQPRTVATGVRFPQDLRNCDACHGGAPQEPEHFNDISRRTCAGCHADAWFQDPALITDSAHFAHPGYQQGDDTMCASCHIGAGVDADITTLHVAQTASPYTDGLVAAIVSVQDMKAGQHPTVVFTLADRNGTPTPLGSPTPATDGGDPSTGAVSPIPRALGRVALTISGPTSPDYQTDNLAGPAAPITEAVPLTLTANAAGQFSYTFTAALPSGASGTWAVGLEARRAATTPFYDAPSDTFFWPYTGEVITEAADNPVTYVDVAAGTSPGGSPVARRQVVSDASCDACHQRLSAHGGLRHQTAYCVMCHAPDTTDWSARPKAAGGDTALDETVDGIDERSVHFKVLVHRIHTGGRTGSAEIDLNRPLAVYGYPGGQDAVNFFDDVRFPGNLADCTLCHQGSTWAIESLAPGALPTVANEAGTLLHPAGPAPVAGEPRTPPVQAACLGCHDTGAALLHAQSNTNPMGEQCVLCHGQGGLLPVGVVHGITP